MSLDLGGRTAFPQAPTCSTLAEQPHGGKAWSALSLFAAPTTGDFIQILHTIFYNQAPRAKVSQPCYGFWLVTVKEFLHRRQETS